MFESSDKSWEDHVLENQSLRRVFCWVLVLVFVLGSAVGIAAYEMFRLHRFSWAFSCDFLILGFLALRLARLIYRRLGR
jgi:hypothetical protein